MKVRFEKLGKYHDEYFCGCSAIGTCKLDHSGYFYPAADYERLEAKLARLVEAAESAYKEWASGTHEREVKAMDKLKAAIAATQGRE